jgi:hypothetical protein
LYHARGLEKSAEWKKGLKSESLFESNCRSLPRAGKNPPSRTSTMPLRKIRQAEQAQRRKLFNISRGMEKSAEWKKGREK